MKKIAVFAATFMLLLTACSKGEDKPVSKTSENHSSTSISMTSTAVSATNEKSADKKEESNTVTELKKGEIGYAKETKHLEYPAKGVSLLGCKDELSYFFKYVGNNCVYYVNDGNTNKEVHKINSVNFGFLSGMYDTDLIEGVVSQSEQEESANGWPFSFHRINKNKGEIIYQGNSSGMPKTKIIGDRIIFYTCDDIKGEGVLNEYNLQSKKVEEIVKHQYKVDNNGELTEGSIVYELDGFNDGVIFEVETADKSKGKGVQSIEVWYYDFNKKETTKLPITSDKKVNYIGGDLNCVIVGDDDEYAENTGNMYLKQDDGTYSHITIPEIASGNYIFESARISDSIIIIRTQQKFYVIDYKNGVYEPIEPNGLLQQGRIITTKKDELNILSDFKAK